MEKEKIDNEYRSYEQMFNFLMYTDFVNLKDDKKMKVIKEIQNIKMEKLQLIPHNKNT
jgi:hypothetical protein